MYRFKFSTPMDELDRAQESIRKAEERYDKIKEGLSSFEPKVTGRSLIKCNSCKKSTQAKNIQFSRYYWYESPHGCMGGACWHTNGFVVVCPKCGEWEHLHEPTKALPNEAQQDIEYRIMERMLRYGQQYGDVHYSDGKYKFTDNIEWQHAREEINLES